MTPPPRPEEPDEDQVLADRGVRAFVEATPAPRPITDYDRAFAENPTALKLAEELLDAENEIARLLALIEEAPHGSIGWDMSCSIKRNGACDCWKSKAKVKP